jgi:hypothetical protein
MLILFASMLATLASILRSRAALVSESLALRHPIGVLQRSAAKRPKLTLFWICLSRPWRDWCSALANERRRANTLVFEELIYAAADAPASKRVF